LWEVEVEDWKGEGDKMYSTVWGITRFTEKNKKIRLGIE